jgi:uncharacterized protein DUF1579
MRQRGPSRSAVLAAAAMACLAAGLYASVPDTPKPAAPAEEGAKQDASQTPELPKATAEHGGMARAEGTWDASVEISIGPPGTPPRLSKAVETNRLCCGGLWLVSEFKSNPGSAPYEGHGITGYEPAKKKYISTWVDSDLTTPMVSEGAYDATGRTLTMRGSMTSRGKTLQWRDVEVWKDDDTRQFTVFMRGPDGKETPSLNIAYTRRK